jgi:hypothetical protein
MTLVAVSSRSINKIPSLHISSNLACFGVIFYKQTGTELGEAETASISEIVIELID